MAKKLRRRGHNVFHKRNTKPLKVLGYGLAGIVLVAAGILVAKWAMNGGIDVAPGSSSTSADSSVDRSETTQGSENANPTEPTRPAVEDPGQVTVKNLKAVYIPVSLLSDSSGLDALLDQAKAAGFNGVLFDLKDDRGCLQYVSSVEQAEAVLKMQASKFSATPALTAETLTAAAKQIRDKGLVPVPRLYAFKDQVAPYALASVKIGVQGSPSTVWHDTSLSRGGKPWMNPCSSEAHRYMVSLASELKGLGFELLMVDGVQFPDREYSADYGSSDLASQPRSQVLTAFISALNEVMGDGLIAGAPALAVAGDATKPFGGNPLTFGSAAVAPAVYASQWSGALTVGSQTVEAPSSAPYETASLLLEQLHLRLQLMEEAKRPAVMPLLQNAEEHRALTQIFGEDAPFVLYQEGTPDFSGFAGN